MSEDKTMQKMMDRFRLRITKTEQDSRSTFRGERFIQPNEEAHDGATIEVDGVHRKMPYAIIPAHEPEYVKNFCLNSKYHLSEPFIPGVDDKKEVKEEGKK